MSGRGRPSNGGPQTQGTNRGPPTTDKLNQELDFERARVLARDLTRGRRPGHNYCWHATPKGLAVLLHASRSDSMLLHSSVQFLSQPFSS